MAATTLAGACGGESGAGPGPEAAPAGGIPAAPGTAAMADRLRQLAAEVDPATVPYASARRVAILQRAPVPSDPRRGILYRLRLAEELLNAGRPEEALDELRDAERILAEGATGPPPREIRLEILRRRAIALVRKGIQRNALGADAEASWRVPLRPEEAHPFPEPWDEATRTLEALLAEEPDELVSRWLLNLAYMARGRYPDGVPERWLIPPAAFESEYEIGEFTDRAGRAGVAVEGLAGAAVREDFDGDGDFDLLTSSRGFEDPLRYFRAEGDGRFREATEAAGLAGLTGGLNLKPADYDDDGDVDVLVLRGAWLPRGWPNSLLRNEGDGTFADVTREAGVYSERPTQTADWGDYDNDGDLDLFVGNETTGARTGSPGEDLLPAEEHRQAHPAELFRNEGNGTFTEVAAGLGVDAVGFVKAVVWGDYDNDGWIDLYISRLDGPNLLFRNLGLSPDGAHAGFREAGRQAGVSEPEASFPAWWWDYDNDGWLDLFVISRGGGATAVVAEYLDVPARYVPPRLYRNLGAGRDGRHRGFEDVAAALELDRVVYAMGSNYGDFDNDGWPDLLAGTGHPALHRITPTRALRNAGGLRFQDVTTSGGFGYLWKGHGVSFGDFDGDGDQDVYVVYGGAFEGDRGRNVLLENPGHGNSWLTVRLVGVEANRGGIGSRIRVRVSTPRGAREVHHLVGSGGSFGANTLQAEIGLGDATAVEELEVRWAGSGRRDLHRDVPLDRIVSVREGAEAAAPEVGDGEHVGDGEG